MAVLNLHAILTSIPDGKDKRYAPVKYEDEDERMHLPSQPEFLPL